MEIVKRSARSVGSLQVGKPSIENGLFSCDFIYTAADKVLTIGEDEIKSVAIQTSKEFEKLLKINGFWKAGEQFGQFETAQRQLSARQIHIICSVRLPPKNPIIINSDKLN